MFEIIYETCGGKTPLFRKKHLKKTVDNMQVLRKKPKKKIATFTYRLPISPCTECYEFRRTFQGNNRTEKGEKTRTVDRNRQLTVSN